MTFPTCAPMYKCIIILIMSFLRSTAFATALSDIRPAVAIVTGGKSGIGKAIAIKIASFPFIDRVLAVSRSIKQEDVEGHDKITPIAADISTEEGRQAILSQIESICGPSKNRTKQIRFLLHSAGVIEPIVSVLNVTPPDLRYAMNINCEAPFFLTTALYEYMTPIDAPGVAGRVLHVSSGAAHGAPPVGWSIYGITKSAFLQSFRVLEREYRELGGKVVVGSFKPGVVDTSMQKTIRNTPEERMPTVELFQAMKEKASTVGLTGARPPPQGALDTPDNVAHFVEFLLVGCEDATFANKDNISEWDIRNPEHFSHWIPE